MTVVNRAMAVAPAVSTARSSSRLSRNRRRSTTAGCWRDTGGDVTISPVSTTAGVSAVRVVDVPVASITRSSWVRGAATTSAPDVTGAGAVVSSVDAGREGGSVVGTVEEVSPVDAGRGAARVAATGAVRSSSAHRGCRASGTVWSSAPVGVGGA
jgi:hypothetical protein